MTSISLKDLPPKYQKQAKERMKKQEGRKSYEEKIEEALIIENQEKRKSKYAANKVVIDGITFDSVKEGNYYSTLKLREKAGEIKNLVLQPRFLLQESFTYNGEDFRKIEYVADFQYIENGKTVVVDTKGYRTDVYKLKKKLFLVAYGKNIKFLEV